MGRRHIYRWHRPISEQKQELKTVLLFTLKDLGGTITGELCHLAAFEGRIAVAGVFKRTFPCFFGKVPGFWLFRFAMVGKAFRIDLYSKPGRRIDLVFDR